jgi:hypothetical protein
MPDLKPLGDFIASVGAPVAIVFVLLYQVFAMDKANRAIMDRQNQLLEAIAQKLGVTVNLK